MAKVLVSDDSIDIRVNMFERLLLAERSRKVPLARVRSVDPHPPIVKLVMHWADQSSVWMSGARPYEGHLVPSTRDPGRTMTIDVDEDGPLFVEVDDEPCEAVATRIEAALRRSSRPPAGALTADGLSAELAFADAETSGVSLKPQPVPMDVPMNVPMDVPMDRDQPPDPPALRSDAVARGAGEDGLVDFGRLETGRTVMDRIETDRPSQRPSARAHTFVVARADGEFTRELASVEPAFADPEDITDLEEALRRRDPLLQGSLPPPPRDQELAHSPAVDVESLARAGFWMLGSGTVAVLTGTASVGAGAAAGLFLLGGGVTACVIGGLAIRLGATRMGS